MDVTVTVARLASIISTIGGVLLGGHVLVGQSTAGVQLAELVALKARVGNADTRTRVEAFHRVWTIGLTSSESSVKLSALDLMTEPVGSSSDHIRMPAVYAIAEIANSTDDAPVKLRALRALSEPLAASQVPIRIAAIDAVNAITARSPREEVVLNAVQALGPAVKSGNNGVRMPAIAGVMRAISGRHNDRADQAAIDLLVDPLESNAVIGGLEVRMLAVVAMERAGLDAMDIGAKAKAMGLLQAYASRGGGEPEARRRAQDAAAAIQASMKP
jgi:hypothetical protein